MKGSYKKFCQELSATNFDSINQKLVSLNRKPFKVQSYQLELTSNMKKMRTSPYLNDKQSFENRQNLYLRIVDLMKMFIRFEEKDFLAFAGRECNMEHLLNKLENLRLHNPEFQLIFYMIKANNRKLIGTYVRLRKQMLIRFNVDKIKFNPIAVHNSNKHFSRENVELGSVKVDYENWGLMAEISKSPISEDMLWWASKGSREIAAVELVRICLWAHVDKLRQENPETL